jgi:hypothetical protein
VSSPTPVIFDDGSKALVPQEQLSAALKDGGKVAQAMQFDDGSKAYVTLDRVHDAIHDGGMLIGAAPQLPQPDMQTADIMVPSAGRIPGAASPVVPVPDSDVYRGLKAGAAIGGLPLAASAGIPALAGSVIGGSLGEAGGRVIAKKVGGGDTAQEIAGDVGGLVGGVGGGMTGDLATGIPSAMKEAAGGLLQSVAHDANKVPVTLDNAGDAALKLMDWQKKTQLGATLNKFLNRVTSPKQGPLTYEEGRDFYSLLSNMSADEKLKMPAPVKYQVQQLAAGLKTDLGNAAETVSRAADYYKGMGDYAKAMKLQGWYDTAKKYLIRGALAAAGGGAASAGIHFINEGMNQ